jgi:hypothetical protein
MTTNEIIMLCIAAYLGGGALIFKTENTLSALVFKVMPMFSAVALTLIAFRVI